MLTARDRRRRRRKWRRLRRRLRKSWRPLLIVAVGLAAVGGLWAYDLSRHENPVRISNRTPRSASPSQQAPVAPQSAPLDAALTKLHDTADPMVVLVLGDSTTAASATNWLNLTTRDLGAELGRPAVLHPWWQPGLRYVHDYDYPDGAGAPLEVWSAGASGQDAAYTLAHLDQLAPMPAASVDWVIIDHGHNVPPGEAFGQFTALMDAAIARWPQAPVTVIRQNPETAEGRAGLLEQTLAAIDRAAASRGVSEVDVHGAFVGDSRPLADLVDQTGVHPTPAGYALWARTFEEWVRANT